MAYTPTFPRPDQLAYRLLELTAICGELPSHLVKRLPESPSYLEKVIHNLKQDKLLRAFYRDKLRGYRLSGKAKAFLLEQTPSRFSFYLTGNAETNLLKSEPARRLRLHRMAEVYVLMQNAGVQIFRDDKPGVFSPAGCSVRSLDHAAFYSSREIKELGVETVKIRGSRMMGALLAASGIYVVYNGAQNFAKWDYRAEQRTKALLTSTLCHNRLSRQYRPGQLYGLLLSSDLDLLYELLSTADTGARCFFLLDGNYEHFYYLTNDRYGEVQVRLLCSNPMRSALDRILSQGLHPRQPGLSVEHDAIGKQGEPVLFSYLPDIPRLNRFHTALQLRERMGTVICFDYQKEVLSRCLDERVQIQTISFEKFERRFFHRQG